MYAFYASDSGLECGVNSYNTKGSPISTSSISKAATGGSLAVSCGGGTWTGTPAAGGTAQAATTTWSMPIPVLGGVPTACSIVTAAYHSSNADGTGATTYYITSLGYNIGWDNNGRQCNQYGSRRVERGLRYVVNF